MHVTLSQISGGGGLGGRKVGRGEALKNAVCLEGTIIPKGKLVERDRQTGN